MEKFLQNIAFRKMLLRAFSSRFSFVKQRLFVYVIQSGLQARSGKTRRIPRVPGVFDCMAEDAALIHPAIPCRQGIENARINRVAGSGRASGKTAPEMTGAAIFQGLLTKWIPPTGIA
jgi:hypothetical protein